nr:iron chelate uptake ABC transporter family permease subunit [Shimia sp. CNT1-13L.2]
MLMLACGFFMLWGLPSFSPFILTLRAERLLALVVVGAAVGASTVVFQTVAANRILTPTIMGFDSLFLMVQTGLVFLFGGLSYAALPVTPKFLLETLLMMLAAMVLFSLLFGRGRRDMHRMILVGVIVGILFRSLTVFLQRLLDPSEFSVVQGAMFASFGAVDLTTLYLATGLCCLVFAVLVPMLRPLDVIALGRSPAVGLGVSYDRALVGLLGITAALVAVSTALVGPISFLGLLVASLAHALMRTHRHALLVPAAALIGAVILVVGQGVFERVLGLQSSLAVIVEFFGGLLFLILVLRGAVR